jgi:hypothetical protein
MAEPGTTWLITTALRCYPARWRRRHGGEAAELAALLIRDGSPAGSIAWSYLAGAAREWLLPRAGRRLSVAACALLVAECSLGASAGMLASAAPARAASTSQARGPAQFRPAQFRPAPGRPCPSWPVPAATSATGHPPMTIWEAGHGRSC